MANYENNGLSFYKRKKKVSYKQVHEVLSWIFGVLITIFVAAALVLLFGMKTYMVGVSMEPTIAEEQPVLIDRFSFVLSKPQAGSVILFLPNGNMNSHYYIKRVVAQPGDTVHVFDGKLYVNGVVSEYVTQYITDAGIAEVEITLHENEYFVIGDQPSDSEDSRSAGIGAVSFDDIKGKVWYKLPCDNGKMGFVK